MEIILGKYAGFCPGVKEAWKLVERELDMDIGIGNQIVILGELIHNRQALERLEKQGVKTVENLDNLPKGSTLIIRAHGESLKTYIKIKKLKIKYVDATCVNVLHVQKQAAELEKNGYQVIVCGEADHPEALATVGHTKNGFIISSVEEAQALSNYPKIGVVSQTTFLSETFNEICKRLKTKSKELISLGTICNFTQLAQKEAGEIAKRVDVVIVVGGKHSSNTKRLAEVAGKIRKTYHIETGKEIKKEWLAGIKKVGLLAGASTPDWVIEEVKERLLNCYNCYDCHPERSEGSSGNASLDSSLRSE